MPSTLVKRGRKRGKETLEQCYVNLSEGIISPRTLWVTRKLKDQHHVYYDRVFLNSDRWLKFAAPMLGQYNLSCNPRPAVGAQDGVADMVLPGTVDAQVASCEAFLNKTTL